MRDKPRFMGTIKEQRSMTRPILIFAIINMLFVEQFYAQDQLTTVVIDAGHGGKDPGTHGKTLKEKDVALAVALKLGKLIEDSCKGVKVVYTRKTDVFVELNERAAIANRAKADLFLCIHCNAACYRPKGSKRDVCNEKRHGSETYVMGLHKTKGNLEVAKRENKSILLEDDYQKNYDGFDPSSDEAAIIFSLYQNAYLNKSINIAGKIQDQYEKSGRENRGVKQAGFLVLWKTAMPSFLSEIGFLTNPKEELFLGSAKGQDTVAKSIFFAFKEYLAELNGEPQGYGSSTGTATESHSKEVASPTEKKETQFGKQNTTAKTTVSNGEGNVFFSVQFLTSNKKLDIDSPTFKKMTKVEEYKVGKIYKYRSGRYTTLSAAAAAQKKIRELGYTDAFAIAFKGNKRISIKEALKESKR